MTSRIPAGMRYYIGAEARLRRTVEDVAMSVFQAWNYEEVITPSVDYYDLFEQGMGQREAQRGFRFTDNDGRLLALRPDVTSSVARMAATLLSERPRPLRFCYAAPVFRQQTQSHAEWRRENTQLGCELIGVGGKPADLEVLRLAAEILSRLNLQSRYCITINNVEIFNGVAAHLNLEESAREQFRRLIDTRETAELQRFLHNHDNPEARAFAQPTQLTGKRNVIQAARNSITNMRSLAALDSLEELWTEIEQHGFDRYFEIDLGDVSSLDYYTGLSLKIFVHGAGTNVGRGGRYDGLTGSFGRAEPAVGFVLNLDALTEVLGRNLAQEKMITIAIAKGRMQESALALLGRAGICLNYGVNSRRLALVDETGQYRFIFVKPADVPVYVEHGIADCGIVGRDVLLESEADLLLPLDLRISRCRIVVAATDATAMTNVQGMIRVATKYPQIARAHFGTCGIPVEIIQLSGSVELAPALGLADMIVDLVETGVTLKENGLMVVEEIAESTGRLVVNRASYQLKSDEVGKLIKVLEGVVEL